MATDFLAFPPFYTIQPVESTRSRQLELWKDAIVEHHRKNKAYTLVVKEYPLFENKDINRKIYFMLLQIIGLMSFVGRLTAEGVRAVMEYIVSSGAGEWEDKATMAR